MKTNYTGIIFVGIAAMTLDIAMAQSDEFDPLDHRKELLNFSTWPGKEGELKPGLDFEPSEYSEIENYITVKDDLSSPQDGRVYRHLVLEDPANKITIKIGVSSNSTEDAQSFFVEKETDLSMPVSTAFKTDVSEGVGDVRWLQGSDYYAFIRNNVYVAIRRGNNVSLDAETSRLLDGALAEGDLEAFYQAKRRLNELERKEKASFAIEELADKIDRKIIGSATSLEKCFPKEDFGLWVNPHETNGSISINLEDDLFIDVRGVAPRTVYLDEKQGSVAVVKPMMRSKPAANEMTRVLIVHAISNELFSRSKEVAVTFPPVTPPPEPENMKLRTREHANFIRKKIEKGEQISKEEYRRMLEKNKGGASN